MKNQLSDCEKSEAEAQELVGETLMQLETAKKMVEALRSDGCKATVVYNAVKSELEQSRARVIFLEELVIKLKADNVEIEGKKDGEFIEKLQAEQLRAAEVKHNEECERCVEEIRNAYKMVEEIKSASGRREAELEAELRKSNYEIEELRASLMDKETELQGVCEECDTLLMQLGSRVPECEVEKEVQSLRAGMESMKARLKSVMEENEALKLDSNKMECDLEEAREAVMKVGWMKGEMDKSERKATRVAEQLEAAQGAIGEMEVELRKLKVQSDQWRKAAEVAAAMLTVGRTGSMEKNCSSFYGDDFDEDLMRKKNVKMLRRFGVLWKK